MGILFRNEGNAPRRRWRCGRYLREGATLFLGMLLVAVIALAISGFDTEGHSRVYAVGTSGDNAAGAQVEAGLRALVSGVADMERYSDVTRNMDISGSGESVLAGVDRLDRRAIRKTAIREGTQKAAELSYYAKQTVLENQMSSDEYYTLLRIVEAEATGGSVESKMMVAGVVLNRVKDSHFPDTICEVVWQSGQFQPTEDGRIYSCTVTDSTVEAVERVLQGEDYSQGALFFVARDSAETTNLSWFDSSLVWLFEYGGHDFYTFKDYVS